jgi:hypothetical protein
MWLKMPFWGMWFKMRIKPFDSEAPFCVPSPSLILAFAAILLIFLLSVRYACQRASFFAFPSQSTSTLFRLLWACPCILLVVIDLFAPFLRVFEHL